MFEKRYNDLVAEGGGWEYDKDANIENNIFFIPKYARWGIAAADTTKIRSVIDNGMRAIEEKIKH